LAVYVHKDNPLEALSLKQIDGIFSNTLRHGGQPINTWGDLGLGDEWARRSISAFGRNSASGTYGFFKDVALAGGDFRSSVKEQPGSSAVVQGVSTDFYAIGYSGIGYRTSGVKMLAISAEDGTAYEPNLENCISGNYPLARLLFVYINKNPNEPLDNLTLEFLKYVLSRQGQEVVHRNGYFPLPAAAAAQIRAMLEN
jgi:phosphate transport system substrate-binding protein